MSGEQKEARNVSGTVVSNKMDKSITVLVERQDQAPDLWEVHQALKEDHGA